MNQNAHRIRLWNFHIGADGWARVAGAAAQRRLATYVDANPGISEFRISMDGFKRIDVTFASEALIGIVSRYRGARDFCLTDVTDHDIFENIAAAAERANVPVTIWNPDCKSASKRGPAFVCRKRLKLFVKAQHQGFRSAPTVTTDYSVFLLFYNDL